MRRNRINFTLLVKHWAQGIDCLFQERHDRFSPIRYGAEYLIPSHLFNQFVFEMEAVFDDVYIPEFNSSDFVVKAKCYFKSKGFYDGSCFFFRQNKSLKVA